jgi:hypothetical protein
MIKRGKSYIQLWHVGRMSHPDFHNGQFHYRASYQPNDKSFTQKDLKLLLRQGNDQLKILKLR